MFLDIHPLILVHSMLNVIMPLFGVICVIIMAMLLVRVLIMHAMRNLSWHRPWIMPMLSLPYLIHHSL